MSVAVNQMPVAVQAQVLRHPNEFDLARIGRDLGRRQRYRDVQPRVDPVEHGYLVRSACCSRSIDPDGGEIDVALIHWDEPLARWRLLRKDHKAAAWLEDSRHFRLSEAVDRLNTDPRRQFWQ